jgi:GntR family transcriptional regulator
MSPPPDSDATRADEAQPRYLQVAGQLTRAIADDTYPVGARLPTELELCEQFGISRFTAREAVRVLSSAGLISRRQRVGTVVVAKPDEARFALDVMSLRGLLQYATETELRLLYVGKTLLSKEQAKEFASTPGAEWIFAVGLRIDAAEVPKPDGVTRPICISRIYLNPILKGIDVKLRERKGAIHALIEREYMRPILRVEQEIQGTVLDADDAANLGAQAGAPALRIIRRYYSDKGQRLEVGDNIHPSDRFSYRMQLRK